MSWPPLLLSTSFPSVGICLLVSGLRQALQSLVTVSDSALSGLSLTPHNTHQRRETLAPMSWLRTGCSSLQEDDAWLSLGWRKFKWRGRFPSSTAWPMARQREQRGWRVQRAEWNLPRRPRNGARPQTSPQPACWGRKGVTEGGRRHRRAMRSPSCGKRAIDWLDRGVGGAARCNVVGRCLP